MRWLRKLAYFFLVLGLVTFAYFLWRDSRDNARLAEARRAWTAVLDQEDKQVSEEVASSLQPLDDYFDNDALPHVGDFLEDFAGPIDTTNFVLKVCFDKLQFRSYGERVNDLVKAALATHLGFPEKFNVAVAGSVERFHTIQQQRDAALRDKAYSLLQGAGVDVDSKRLEKLLHKAEATAQHAAFESIGREAAIDFGGVIAGKESAMVALQYLIIDRAMVALGTRLGVVTVGAEVAGATAGGGAVTGVGAAPGLALAAGGIAVTLVIDLAVEWWLKGKAEAKMREQVGEIRIEVRKQLSHYMQESAEKLRCERAVLLDAAIRN